MDHSGPEPLRRAYTVGEVRTLTPNGRELYVNTRMIEVERHASRVDLTIYGVAHWEKGKAEAPGVPSMVLYQHRVSGDVSVTHDIIPVEAGADA